MLTTAHGFKKPELTDAPSALRTAINANVDTLEALAGGKSIITAAEARTNIAYGTLTTPDRVTGVVLPTNGLIVVNYFALMKITANQPGNKAALFINNVQLSSGIPNFAGQGVQEAIDSSTTPAPGRYQPLFTCGAGLVLSNSSAAVDISADSGPTPLVFGANLDASSPARWAVGGATYDQVVTPGPVKVYMDAGTYTVEVRFKSAVSGTVTVKNRRLFVGVIS